MEVRCYDCGRLVSQGEAIKQKEGSGNVGGGGYSHKSGWGAGAGSWQSTGKSYWLCLPCDRRRVENQRFWQLVTLGIVVALIVVVLVVYLIVNPR